MAIFNSYVSLPERTVLVRNETEAFDGGFMPQLLDFSKPWKEPAIRFVKDPHLLRQPWSKLPTKAWLISISTQLPKTMVPFNSSSSNCWDSQQEDKQLREKSKLCRSELFDPANSLLMALCGFKQCPNLHKRSTKHGQFTNISKHVPNNSPFTHILT